MLEATEHQIDVFLLETHPVVLQSELSEYVTLGVGLKIQTTTLYVSL